MTERQESRLSKSVHAARGWVRAGWNIARYGFAEGKLPRQRMDDLLVDPFLTSEGIEELLVLARETPSLILKLGAVRKIQTSPTFKIMEDLTRLNLPGGD